MNRLDELAGWCHIRFILPVHPAGLSRQSITSNLAARRFLPQIAFMTPKALLDQILRLPLEERLQLVEEIWDSIAAKPADVPVPDWHKAELDRRLDGPEPGPGLTWDEVRAKLRSGER
jgi:putative addiction module component (TIGR02574 family)